MDVPGGGRAYVGVAVHSRATLQNALRETCAALPPVQVQNRLMSCSDRELGLALAGMDPDAVDEILSHIARIKAARVREELRLQEFRHVESRFVEEALRTIIESLETNRMARGRRSYLRPRKPRAER